MGKKAALLALIITLTCSLQQAVAKPAESIDDLLSLPLEQLARMDYVIYSASKKAEKVSQTPSAVYVISQEDIRRSGVTTIMEALRMAPGVQVAQIDARRWAISVRGFTGEFTEKLLVMIDGRSVYNSLFGGVIWNTKDVMLEDVERIEVIRGPGAVLWGVNAVNGVINVITKNSRDTLGGIVTAAAGNEERLLSNIRYGKKIGNTSYRVYGQYKDRNQSHFQGGGDAHDSWDIEQGGFRMDSAPTKEDQLTLQGDVYSGQERQLVRQNFFTPPYQQQYFDERDLIGGNITTSWDHRLENDSTFKLSSYYSHESYTINLPRQTINTFNSDAQHTVNIGEHQELIWGAGIRLIWDNVRGGLVPLVTDPQVYTPIYNVFFQDKIAVVPEKLFLTFGAKLEYHPIGFQPQPSIKLSWLASDKQSFWASIAQAARVPNRSNREIDNPIGVAPGPGLLFLYGNADLDAERLTAYEMGYRVQPGDRLSIDTAMFINHYSKLIGFIPGAREIRENAIVQPLINQNSMYGETYGAEISADLQAQSWLKFRANYSTIYMQLHTRNALAQSNVIGTERNMPRHQFVIRAMIDLPHNWSFDPAIYYASDVKSRNIPAYLRADARIGWKPWPELELSLIGQNLFDNRHAESSASITTAGRREIERSLYGKVAWTF